MENTFKSSVFGGFNRDDVIRYIEKTSLESKQQIEALEQESDGLCRENAELRNKLAAAERERDKLAESYSTASSAQDALKKGLTAAQETISELRAQIEEGAQKLASAKADCDLQLKAKEESAEQRIAELEAQHAERLSAAEQERKRLLSELDELRPQVEEYGRVKAHIADIELSARERADALDARARGDRECSLAQRFDVARELGKSVGTLDILAWAVEDACHGNPLSQCAPHARCPACTRALPLPHIDVACASVKHNILVKRRQVPFTESWVPQLVEWHPRMVDGPRERNRRWGSWANL